MAGATGSGLGRPLFKGAGPATALAAAGKRIAVAASCDVRLLDVGSKPKRLPHVGYCREDAGDSAVFGLWLGRNTIVEEVYISPSPHGETYQLWAGPPGGKLHEVGSDWGWTDSDVPPTYGCDRMVAAGGGLIAITPVANDLGEGIACATHSSTTVTLRGALDRKLTLAGAWGALATNGERVALVGYDQSGKRTGELAMLGVDGKRLGAPHFTAQDVKTAFQGWLTPVGLFLASKRGLVGPNGRVLVKSYANLAIGEGRVVYNRGKLVRARRLKGGPDRVITRLPTLDVQFAAGSYGIAVMTGMESDRLAVYRIPWRTIDAVLPR